MQWENELCQRLLRVIPLSEKSIKYVKDSDDEQEEMLVHKILLSVAKKVHEKREPVKLREIADDLYESVTKKEMDNVRQLLKKTLIPSNIVEKLNLGKKDIRFLPTAYRFQETKKVESSSGQSIREPLGPVIELPREYFPVPSGLISLHVQKSSLCSVLEKIEDDFGQGKISEPLYTSMRTDYEAMLEKLTKQLEEQNELVKLLNLDN
jgi:hypothetical protein